MIAEQKKAGTQQTTQRNIFEEAKQSDEKNKNE
jgi:hypothetical protein